MGTKMIYRISVIVNTVLSLVFILMGIIGTINIKAIESASVIILAFILFAFSIFLLFDLVCHRTYILNREKQPLPGWINTYGKVIFGFSILALLMVLFMNLAAAYAFLKDVNEFPKKQQPFFIIFLFLLLLSVVTTICNAVGYSKSVKENKHILNEYIDDIGSRL